MLGLPVLLGLLAVVAGMLPKLESTCETLANRIHITKEEFNKAKELMRTCEEDIEMMKCEGSCVSSTMPSAMERWVGAPVAGVCEVFMPGPGSRRTASAAARLATTRRWSRSGGATTRTASCCRGRSHRCRCRVCTCTIRHVSRVYNNYNMFARVVGDSEGAQWV